MSRKPPGLRTALVTYLLIVVLGLGAAGAHALWGQSGTVAVTVTAGTWAPSGKVGLVACGHRVDGDRYSDIVVSWEAVDADKYLLTVTPNSGISPNPAEAPQPGVGDTVSKTLRLNRTNDSGKGEYTLTITPMAKSQPGTPTKIDVVLEHKKEATVTCVPFA